MNDGHLKEYYVFSPFLRIFHWIMVASITVLFFTGLYIGNPFFIGTQGLEPTFAFRERLSMETIRLIHFGVAYIFVVSFILRVYGFIINRGDRLFPQFWKKQYYTDLIDTKLHYMFLKDRHKPFLRNPLARGSYVAVYFMILIEAVTGFAMYYMINPNGWGAKIFGWFNHLFVDEYVVHLIHHYVAWAIILFAIVHVYMAARADFMDGEGEISSMFSGKKFLAHQPTDLGDIANETDHGARHR
jgi:Ni/Fe-hydrogenase 1 B-type cytochrome subunit